MCVLVVPRANHIDQLAYQGAQGIKFRALTCNERMCLIPLTSDLRKICAQYIALIASIGPRRSQSTLTLEFGFVHHGTTHATKTTNITTAAARPRRAALRSVMAHPPAPT
jgi:hypothetical protein